MFSVNLAELIVLFLKTFSHMIKNWKEFIFLEVLSDQFLWRDYDVDRV